MSFIFSLSFLDFFPSILRLFSFSSRWRFFRVNVAFDNFLTHLVSLL